MIFIKILKYDDSDDYEIITNGDRDELVQLIARLIVEDKLFFDAYMIAEILYKNENSQN